jgi:class 3 adenylate cyclase
VASPPTGTLTFLFTDIEASTKLWEQNAQAMQIALARHDEVLRSALEGRGGYIFKTVGDAFCCDFPTAPDALEAALEAQRRLLSSEWEETGPLRVRMALHTGSAGQVVPLLRTISSHLKFITPSRAQRYVPGDRERSCKRCRPR